jgi:hypothetical protein
MDQATANATQQEIARQSVTLKFGEGLHFLFVSPRSSRREPISHSSGLFMERALETIVDVADETIGFV